MSNADVLSALVPVLEARVAAAEAVLDPRSPPRLVLDSWVVVSRDSHLRGLWVAADQQVEYGLFPGCRPVLFPASIARLLLDHAQAVLGPSGERLELLYFVDWYRLDLEEASFQLAAVKGESELNDNPDIVDPVAGNA